MPSDLGLPSRYETPELIAHGGMADVFRATDRALGRTVAIKVLAERYARDEELRLRFAREAQTAASLTGQPNIISIYDVGEEAGLPFIVMEFVPGGSVADRLRSEKPSPDQALAWLEQTARGLDGAHARQIIHRDVKPGNLLIGSDGEVRVSDFGIAHAAAFDTLTGAGTILGTSGYMSPEQARGHRATPASDRYALGCVAFELLTGRRPFAGDSPTAEAARHATAPVPSASAANPTLPAGLDDVFRRALAKDPADRHGSSAELAMAMRRAFIESTSVTRRLETAPTAFAAPGRRFRGPARWAALVGGALVLVVAGLAVAWATRTDARGAEGQTIVLTRTHTETVRGDPQVQTETVTAPSAGDTTPTQASGATLNDQGFRLLQAGDFAGALPLFEQAVPRLAGTGGLAEAYASFNLAQTRFALGRCDGVLGLLQRSEEIQGARKPIDRLRKRADRRCEGKDNARPERDD